MQINTTVTLTNSAGDSIELTGQELGELRGSVAETAVTGYEKYIGLPVLIRTVTHHYSGRVIEVVGMTLTLDEAAWIADDGRFNEAVRDPDNFAEVEPYAKPVVIGLGAILDVTEISKTVTKVK